MDVRVRGGTAVADRPRCRRRRCTGSGSTTAPPPPARLARWCNTCATRRRRISRTCARLHFGPAPTAWSSIRRRSAISRSSTRLTAAGPDRCSHEIDRTHHPDGRPPAPRLAAAAAGGARADPGSARRRRGVRLPQHRARQGARHAEDRSTMSSVSSPAPRSVPPARAISSRCGSRSRPCRAFACCSTSSRRRSSRSLAAELDDLADLRDELDRTLARRAPGAGARRRRDPRRRRCRSSTICAASADPGKQRIAEMEEAERARTGISSLKIRYNRVFGYYIEISQVEPRQRAARLPPQADDCRRRAVHHPGAQGLRRKGARRRRAHSRARGRALRRARGRASPRKRRACRTPHAGSPSLDVLGALAETAARPELHQAA